MHGLTVQSDLDLAAPRLATSAVPGPRASPDLIFYRTGPGPVPSEPPPGRVVAESAPPDGSAGAAVVATDDGVVVRFYAESEFAFSADGTTVAWRTHPGVPVEVAAFRACGSVIASALMEAGHLVFHASAVEMGGQAVAFAAHSSGGKSTLAALFCRSGARLVSDDVLRVDGGRCYPAATSLRLRPDPPIAGRDHGGSSAWRTHDGRTAVEYEPCALGDAPLAAIIVPKPDPSAAEVTVTRVVGSSAALLLSWFLRSRAWRQPSRSDRQLSQLAATVQEVPVWRCRLPWGASFDAPLPSEVLGAIGLPGLMAPAR